MRSILSLYGNQADNASATDDLIPHAFIRCAECITGRHLLSKIISSTITSLGLAEDAVRETIDHVSGLAVVLKDILEGRRGSGRVIKKFVLVLDGIEEQREAQQLLLPALARLGEVVSLVSRCFVVLYGAMWLTACWIHRYLRCAWS